MNAITIKSIIGYIVYLIGLAMFSYNTNLILAISLIMIIAGNNLEQNAHRTFNGGK